MSRNLNADLNKTIILGQAKEIVSLCEKNKILTEALEKIAKYSNVMIGYGFEDINNWATEALNTNH